MKTLLLIGLWIVTQARAPGCGGWPPQQNNPPSIQSLLADPDEIGPLGISEIECLATDPDPLDQLVYTWEASAGTISGTTSRVSWIAPTTTGPFYITVTVADGKGGSVQANVLVTVVAPANTPPTASCTATPAEGDTDTLFVFDASTSSDVEDLPDALLVRFDFDNDGIWDTEFNQEKVASHTYVAAGLATARVEVLDTGGLIGSATLPIQVNEAVSSRVLLLIEADVAAALAQELAAYQSLIRNQFHVQVAIDVSQNWASLGAPGIRSYLRQQYQSGGIEGVIVAGKIPYPIFHHDSGAYCIAPLYYEDFDMQWTDANQDGIFEQKAIDANNATEIWSAWWLPPIDNPTSSQVIESLRTFLQKANAFHSGAATGAGSLLAASAEFGSETANSWIPMMVNAGAFTSDQIQLNYGGYYNFLNGWRQQAWEHVHIISHGTPEGIYFQDGSFLVSDYLTENQVNKGGRFVTFSGCLNGNLHGDYNSPVPKPSRSIASQMIFSAQSLTLSTYGSVTSQSTGLVASYHAPLFAGIKQRFVGRGFFDLRNSDVVWYQDHYMFRTKDDKCLAGDPFYHVP